MLCYVNLLFDLFALPSTKHWPGLFELPFVVPDYIRDQQLVIEAILQQMGPATCWRQAAPTELSSHESNIVTIYKSIQIMSKCQQIQQWNLLTCQLQNDAPRHFTSFYCVHRLPNSVSLKGSMWASGWIVPKALISRVYLQGWYYICWSLCSILQWCSCQLQRQQATCSKSTSGSSHCTPQS